MKKLAPIISLVFLTAIAAYILLVSPHVDIFINGFLVTMSALTGLWILSLILKDSSIVDIYWGFGFVLMVAFYLWTLGEEYWHTRNFLFTGLVSVWGLRLAIYLGIRNIGKGEDYRYQEMRKEAGKHWWWFSYFKVFLLQGTLLWVISSVFLPVMLGGEELILTDYIGIVLWIVGLYFEAMGDWQLSRFKKQPENKGKVMNKGLWRYTRHPNYFGDSVIWWGYFFFSLSYHNGIVWMFSPIIMTLLLVKISGAAMLERSLKKTKPKYKEYLEKTSAFIPMPPKG